VLLKNGKITGVFENSPKKYASRHLTTGFLMVINKEYVELQQEHQASLIKSKDGLPSRDTKLQQSLWTTTAHYHLSS